MNDLKKEKWIQLTFAKAASSVFGVTLYLRRIKKRKNSGVLIASLVARLLLRNPLIEGLKDWQRLRSLLRQIKKGKITLF
ncbi:hypothetical protein ACFFH4_09965 [Halalkalibacter alkalisediminis]|uniref:Uncharacterized protein n=1 Tax=Halalkalibacter alkalisediminis TaxID=935616 RepID=A0ABV6NGV5_9BACI